MINTLDDFKPGSSTLERKVTMGFGIALFTLCAVALLSFISISQFSGHTRWSDHTREVLNNIAILRADINQIDADVRGFIITGAEQDFNLLQAHRQSADAMVQQIRAQTQDNLEQQTYAAQLETLMKQQRQWRDNLMRQRREQGFAAAQARFASGEGDTFVDQVHKTLDAMSGEENSLLSSRTDAQISSGHLTVLIISVGTFLAFAAVIAGGVFVKRDAARRRQTQEQLDNIFRLSLDFICVADFNGYFKEINPSWVQALGFTRQEILSRPFLEFVHPDDIQATNDQTANLANGIDVISFENRYRCKDGSYRWLTWKAVLGPDGKKIYATGRDITERKAIEEKMRQAQAQAVEANESKSRFLANMSHEIRTPMAAIIGYADLILDPEQTPSDRLEHINTIRRNGEHLLTIINDVLDLSKIEAGKFQIEWVECCPCQILSDVASMMRVRAVEKLVRLEVKNEGLVPSKIRTDPARLRQILINLVGNAIKFTDEGWVRLIMRLDEQPAGATRLRFDIIDTGIGMSRQQVGQLFQPFVQVDGSMTRRFGGTGLGLTISKRLAELLGGKIEVDSSPNRGSTFTVFVDPGPLEGVQRLKNCREALAGLTLNQPANRTALRLKGRILLVDDGQDNRKLLSVYLRDAGADVVLAENGRIGVDEALAACSHGEPFGVILMDMQMPELDGYGASALLRSKGYAGPIVALTAHAFAEDRAKCLKAGCTDYLSKPVSRQDLLKMVAKYLNLSDSQSADAVPEAPAIASAATFPAGIQIHAQDGDQALQSSLQDAQMRPFLDGYISDLPNVVAELQTSIDKSDLQALSAKIHNLKGTGGLYGLMPITDAAAKVELLMHEGAHIDAVALEVEKLIELIRNVKGFDGRNSPSTARAHPTDRA